jgi:hypothetical protein
LEDFLVLGGWITGEFRLTKRGAFQGFQEALDRLSILDKGVFGMMNHLEYCDHLVGHLGQIGVEGG